MARFYQFVSQIWEEDDGTIDYYAAESFDEEGESSEILVHGEGTDWNDAVKQIAQAHADSFPNVS